MIQGFALGLCLPKTAWPPTLNDFENYKGKWNKEVLHNTNAIHIEIGSGKGKFICELALQNPHINFIAIDRAESILVILSKKVDLEKLDNIRNI